MIIGKDQRLCMKGICFGSYKDENKELIPIPPLPGKGRMSFGLAATDDDRIIGVGGHNFTYDTMTKVHILDTNAQKFQWQSLPDMPSKNRSSPSSSNACMD